jgi:hypothetical protein
MGGVEGATSCQLCAAETEQTRSGPSTFAVLSGKHGVLLHAAIGDWNLDRTGNKYTWSSTYDRPHLRPQ